MQFILPLFLILIITILFINFFKLIKKNANVPPSPWRLPVIGNLHQLGRHPHRSLCSLSHRYGPLMLLHLGQVPVLVVSSADAAHGVLKTHDRAFASRPQSKLFKKLLYDGRDVGLSPYGEYWRQMKSVCVTHLLNNKKVRSFKNVREEEVKVMMEKIKKAASSSSPLNVSQVFSTLTKDVICRVALGRTYGKNFNDLMRNFIHMLGIFALGDYVPWLGWIDQILGLDDKLDKIGKEFDEFLEGVVQDHLDRGKRNVDFVDVLLEIQRDKKLGFEIDMLSVKALILDVFVGGMDTSYALLEWAMTELLRHPEAMNKLQHEVRTIERQKPILSEEDIRNMKYLQAVIKETLRLHPPIPLLVPRESIQDVVLKDYHIPSGTQVFINVWAIGRDTATWGPDAEAFRPERHLDSPVDFRGQYFELIPFGAGRRICPGIAFALAIVELVLANVVRRFDWEIVTEPTEGRNGVIAESTGMAVHRMHPLIAFPHLTGEGF